MLREAPRGAARGAGHGGPPGRIGSSGAASAPWIRSSAPDAGPQRERISS